MLILQQTIPHVFELILNRPEKHNAFNAQLIRELRQQLNILADNPDCHVLILKANGKNFCAGADLEWMQSMVNYSFDENVQDALQLAALLEQLNRFPVPTIAMVQGATYGGGVGLIACCDMAFVAPNASFCFSEVKLGLAPSTISPYVIASIGEKAARRYFLSAEVFDAPTAAKLNLINDVVEQETLQSYVETLAKNIAGYGHGALAACKDLIRNVVSLPQEQLADYTATHIATRRISTDAQQRLGAFLCSKKS